MGVLSKTRSTGIPLCSISMLLLLALAISFRPVQASEILVGKVISLDKERGCLTLEVSRSSSTALDGGTQVQVSFKGAPARFDGLEAGDVVRLTVEGTDDQGRYIASKVRPFRGCWRRDKTGVRYRLHQGWRRGMRHGRGAGRMGGRTH